MDHVGSMETISKRLVEGDGFWLYPTRSTGVDEVLTCFEKQAVNFGNLRRTVPNRCTAFTSLSY